MKVVKNQTVMDNSIADNPKLEFYNLIYGLTLLAWLLLFVVRTWFFVSVSFFSLLVHVRTSP